MTTHICPRCGREDRCSYGSWPDRHPVMATIGGLFTLTLMAMMFSVYPVAAWSMTALAGVYLGGRAASRERSRRAALATRADYEHAALIARSMPQPIQFPRRDELPPRHVMNRWPTTPMQTARMPR